MQQSNFRIVFFRYINRKPVEDFIAELSDATQAKIHKSINLIAIHGSRAGWPVVKKVDKGLYELRIRGVAEIRLFFVVIEMSVIILHAFKKKSQKLPLKELRLARKRLTQVYRI